VVEVGVPSELGGAELYELGEIEEHGFVAEG
jgi:hypothetical protein